jgi:hypothetical protein
MHHGAHVVSQCCYFFWQLQFFIPLLLSSGLILKRQSRHSNVNFVIHLLLLQWQNWPSDCSNAEKTWGCEAVKTTRDTRVKGCQNTIRTARKFFCVFFSCVDSNFKEVTCILRIYIGYDSTKWFLAIIGHCHVQRQSTLDYRYLTLLCDNLKKRMFLQNFFSWHYFGNLLCFSSYRHHSTILQPNKKFMSKKSFKS